MKTAFNVSLLRQQANELERGGVSERTGGILLHGAIDEVQRLRAELERVQGSPIGEPADSVAGGLVVELPPFPQLALSRRVGQLEEALMQVRGELTIEAAGTSAAIPTCWQIIDVALAGGTTE